MPQTEFGEEEAIYRKKGGKEGTYRLIHSFGQFLSDGISLSLQQISLQTPYNTELYYKACTWLLDSLPIFPKNAVRQALGGRGAAEGNSKQCKPFSPTLYIFCIFRRKVLTNSVGQILHCGH